MLASVCASILFMTLQTDKWGFALTLPFTTTPISERERPGHFHYLYPLPPDWYLYIHVNTFKLLYFNPPKRHSSLYRWHHQLHPYSPPPLHPSASLCHHPQISRNHPLSTPHCFDTNCTLSRSNCLAVFSLLAQKFTLTLDTHWKGPHISHIRQVSSAMW